MCVNYTAAKDAAKAVVEDIEASGGRAIHVRGDVSNENEIQELFQQSAEQLGPVTGLVNNAGIMGSRGRVDELDRERTRRMLDVNVLGPFLCCKTAIRYMSNRHGGRGGAIVNISSASSKHGGVGSYINFAASKSALDTLTTAVAKEQAAQSIRVNCV